MTKSVIRVINSGTNYFLCKNFKEVTSISLAMAINNIPNNDKINKAISQLAPVTENMAVPRNARIKIKGALNDLKDKNVAPAIRAANVISVLEDISQDPNMPSHIRVIIWSAISQLEAIR